MKNDLRKRVDAFTGRCRKEDVNLHGFILSVNGREKAKAYYDDENNITSYKMTDRDKDMNSMTDLDDDKVAALYEMLSKKEIEETAFTDVLITENYATRREIYGYYENGLFARAKIELFRDRDNNLYLTTEMIDAKDNKPDGVTLLKGMRLPQELEDYYHSIWK